MLVAAKPLSIGDRILNAGDPLTQDDIDRIGVARVEILLSRRALTYAEGNAVVADRMEAMESQLEDLRGTIATLTAAVANLTQESVALAPTAVLACPACDYQANTEHGLKIHTARAHKE